MRRLLKRPALYRQIRRLARSLRFRLAISYAIFFAILVVFVGLILRPMLGSSLESELQLVIDEEWAAAKGYMKIENYRPEWGYDRADPEESLIVNKIQGGVYLLTDSSGKVLERSETYKGIPLSSLADITAVLSNKNNRVWTYKQDEDGVWYLLRQGVMVDVRQNRYYMVIGKPLSEIQGMVGTFTRYYIFVVVGAILVGMVLGWVVAGRALIPLNSVAQAAQEIRGSNLKVRIPTRGADDELDRLIGAFNDMTSRLDKSFEQIRQFSTDVSHELRTPLTSIRGQLEVALFTAKTSDDFRDAMVDALQDVEHLSNIVRALLQLSQAESGQLVLQMSQLDLSPLVEDIADQFQIPAEEQKLTLETAIQHDGCVIKADRTQIGRLITNLISNAVKYTPAGGRVKIELKRADDLVQLIVSDTGVGIAADALPHIFDRFYRVRKMQTKSVQGLGLGLSFVAWIVQVHEGKIDVESKEGNGTTFTVSLPAFDFVVEELTAPLSLIASARPGSPS
ncbi:MAG TPA: ATP-binding protein [Bryobacteraceae bacterium]|jgi:heavy metal sensor kinase